MSIVRVHAREQGVGSAICSRPPTQAGYSFPLSSATSCLESAFVNAHRRTEQATALVSAQLMVWLISAVEDLVTKRPRLAVSLSQISAQRTVDFAHRIESFSIDNIARRLARSLVHFSERLGTTEGDGTVRMMPFTHELLSRHIGTSREIVSRYMNQFRKQGYFALFPSGDRPLPRCPGHVGRQTCTFGGCLFVVLKWHRLGRNLPPHIEELTVSMAFRGE